MFHLNTQVLALIFTASIAGVSTSCNKCSGEKASVDGTAETGKPNTAADSAPAVTELGIVDTVVGDGAEAVDGKKVTVHYTGTLTNGTKFDSSLDRNSPFTFTLGAGQVIQGWDQGFKGMKIGGKRKLTIPPTLGYGDRGVGGVIPANSVLLFDVELLKVE